MSYAPDGLGDTRVWEGFRKGGAVKSGLPGLAYTSEAFFALERDRVLAHNWCLVGFAHELARPGDVVPSSVGGLPILLVRGKDGRLRAFHNVCRHRGLLLVDQPCRRRTLVCPYHNWAYGLDGRLLNAPHFGGANRHDADGFRYDAHGLREISCRQWHDWVFANLDGAAPDFERFVAPLAPYVEGLALDGVEPLFKVDSGEFACNWKFICENFVEPYHVPVVHPRTAAGQPLAQHYMVGDRHLVGCAIDVEQAAEAKRANLCLDFSARYLLLFPNFLFFIYFGEETQINVMLNQPLGPDRTHQRRVIYQLGGSRPDQEAIGEWVALTEAVIAEDRAMLERLQRGRASPVTRDGGVLSPVWEESEHAFQTMVADAVAR